MRFELGSNHFDDEIQLRHKYHALTDLHQSSKRIFQMKNQKCVGRKILLISTKKERSSVRSYERKTLQS